MCKRKGAGGAEVFHPLFLSLLCPELQLPRGGADGEGAMEFRACGMHCDVSCITTRPHVCAVVAVGSMGEEFVVSRRHLQRSRET